MRTKTLLALIAVALLVTPLAQAEDDGKEIMVAKGSQTTTVSWAEFFPKTVGSNSAWDTNTTSGLRWMKSGTPILYAPLTGIADGAVLENITFFVKDISNAALVTAELCTYRVNTNGLGASCSCEEIGHTGGEFKDPGLEPGNTIISKDFTIDLDSTPQVYTQIRYQWDSDDNNVSEVYNYVLKVDLGATSTAGGTSIKGVRVTWKPTVRDYDDYSFVDLTGYNEGFKNAIEALYQAGITAGCGGSEPGVDLQYCPTNSVTRAQMAVFLSGSLGLYWPAE